MSTGTDVELLTRLADSLDRGESLPDEHRHYVAAWLRFAVAELKKPRTKPKRPAHRERRWNTVDALLMFGMKVIHQKQTQTRACHEIAEAFGLASSKTVSENAEFKAGKAMILDSFRRARFIRRTPKK